MAEKGFSEINRTLRDDISALWDDCFGDLPLVKQRLLKAFGMKNHKKVYVHQPRKLLTEEDWCRCAQTMYRNDKHFSPNSPQVQVAKETVDAILKDFMKGKSRAARYLRYFMKDKKITVGVYKSLKNDAGMDGYNPLTKEIYIDLNAGCFTPETNGVACLDELACTVGHEIGHAIEKLHRSAKCDSANFSSNGWEVELFCDTLGFALCAESGYCLQKSIDIRQNMAKRCHAVCNEGNPHPPIGYRADYAVLIQKIYEAENNQPHEFSAQVKNTEWNAEKVQSDLPNLATDKEK